MIGLVIAFAVAFPLYLLRTRSQTSCPTLLSTVHSALPRRVAWIVSCVAVVIFLLLPTTFFAFFKVYSMSNDALKPDIERGERVVVLKARFIELTIDTGDIVAFQRDGRTYLRKVMRVDKDNVWVSDKSSERQIPRRNIIGKVIHTYRLNK